MKQMVLNERHLLVTSKSGILCAGDEDVACIFTFLVLYWSILSSANQRCAIPADYDVAPQHPCNSGVSSKDKVKLEPTQLALNPVSFRLLFAIFPSSTLLHPNEALQYTQTSPTQYKKPQPWLAQLSEPRPTCSHLTTLRLISQRMARPYVLPNIT